MLICKYCGFHDYIKYGKSQGIHYFKCKSCGHKFSDSPKFWRMRNSRENIDQTMIAYFGKGEKLLAISNQISINLSTIHRWLIKYSKMFHKFNSRLNIKVSEYWLINQNKIVIQGKEYILWDIIDSRSCYLILSHIAPSGNLADLSKLFNVSVKRAGKAQRIISIPSTMMELENGIEQSLKIQTTVTWNDKHIEQFRNKMLHRNVLRTLKSLSNIEYLFSGFAIHYNFFSDHIWMNGTTPAKEAKIDLQILHWKDLIQLCETNITLH